VTRNTPIDPCRGEDPVIVHEVRGITGDLRFGVACAATLREYAEGHVLHDGTVLTEDVAAQTIIDMGSRSNVTGWPLLRALQVLLPDSGPVRDYEDKLWRLRAKWSLENNEQAINAEAARLRAEDTALGDRSAIAGDEFILGRPATPPALWGAGPDVLWARHQSLMIVAPTGVGKTTLAGLLIRAQLFGGDVLGLPVAPIAGTILVLAMDRPEQIGAALGRQFGEQHRNALQQQLLVRPGPPPADLADDPAVLARMAEHYGAAVVYIDSLKDAALGLSNDSVGAGYNLARQTLIRSGRDLCELHHLTKAGATPFGSAWLEGGAGSVVQLDGGPGSTAGRLVHRKQPAHKVGPWTVSFDRDRGEINRDDPEQVATAPRATEVDLVALARDGLTAADAARHLYGTTEPSRADQERARRTLARDSRLRCAPGDRGRGGRPSTWWPL
jgi:hypothetical protein